MSDFSTQIQNPNDDSYIDTGVDQETGVTRGMSADTSPEYRKQLDEEAWMKDMQDTAEKHETEDSLLSLAALLLQRKEEKKKLENAVKGLTAEITDLDARLSDAMLEAGLDSFSGNGRTFYLSTKTFASPKAGMSDELISALREHGSGDLVKETVNSSTLSAFVREMKELNADELPGWLTDVVSVFEKTTVGIRKK